KLATNTPMYEKMIDDMDINCGDVLDGLSLQAKGREIVDKWLEVASGAPSKSEALGYGDAEFVPWTVGATM
ncbi:MAG: altronate dehydratase, partial [Rubrimonas sp.]